MSVEAAIRDFVSAIHRETMGRGHVEEIKLDSETLDRLAAKQFPNIHPNVLHVMSMTMNCPTGIVRLTRGSR